MEGKRGWYSDYTLAEIRRHIMINKEALEIIERKLKQGKRIELEYNHQTKEIKLLEHKITRIKIENKD